MALIGPLSRGAVLGGHEAAVCRLEVRGERSRAAEYQRKELVW